MNELTKDTLAIARELEQEGYRKSLKGKAGIRIEIMKETDACQCCSCEAIFPYSLIVRGYCPNCGSGNWVYGYIDEPEPKEV